MDEDARMRKGREQELRAKQRKFPLREKSRRGNLSCASVEQPASLTAAMRKAVTAVKPAIR